MSACSKATIITRRMSDNTAGYAVSDGFKETSV